MSAPRFPAVVDREGRIVPLHSERTMRHREKQVWVSIHERPASETRSNGANRYLWGVLYAELAAATGNDPETIHLGLKREAVRVGVLEPQYILMGSTLLESEPTTVAEDTVFWGYVSWIRHQAEHGDLTGSPLHLPEPGE